MKIIVADDHAIITDGLVAILKQVPDYEVVSSLSNGKEVLHKLDEAKIDLVIMDINMPVMDGIEATAAIRKKHPKVKILILSMYDKDGFIKNTIEAGAHGYLLKNSGKDEILNAITMIFKEGTYFSPNVSKALISELRTSATLEGVHLSPKEKEILELLSEGLTTQ